MFLSNWSLPPPFIEDKSYNQEEKDFYLEWMTKEAQILFSYPLGFSATFILIRKGFLPHMKLLFYFLYGLFN